MRRLASRLVLLPMLGCAAPRPAVRPVVRPAAQVVGQRVDDLRAPGLDGREVRLRDAAGRVRVVDFWASWCEPCREQLPLLERLSREHAELAVYAISFDDDRAALEAFLGAVPVSFPVLWDRGGDALGDRLSIRRLPTTWVIDRTGVVRWVHVGFDAAEGARLAGEVRQLLQEAQPR